MPDTINLFKVFIASPGDLGEERESIRSIIQQFNEEEAINHKVQYFPVYWEKVAGGMCDRPQSAINIELDQCDYMTVILWDRWGTPTGNQDEQNYNSGVEEEFYRAVECYKDESAPMKDVVVIFKEITQKQRDDPGAQVAQVIAFREKLDRERNVLYKEFSEQNQYAKIVRLQLRKWLANDRHGCGKVVHNFQLEFSPYQNRNIEAIAFPGEDLDRDGYVLRRLEEIRDMTDTNSVTRAKEEYRELVLETKDIAAKNDYAKYLYRLGQLDKADELYREILTEAKAQNKLGWISRANANLSIIKKSEGLIDEAQQLLEESLVFNRMLNHDIGIADNFRHLSNIKRLKGNMDSALTDANEAIRIFRKFKYKPGLADSFSDLGVLYRIKCNLDKADECYRDSTKLNIELGRYSCLADNCSHLGTIARIRGKLEKAKQYYQESLSTNYELRRKHGIAEGEGHLAMVAMEIGDLTSASNHFNMALNAATEINNQEVTAKVFSGMAKVAIYERDWTSAEDALDEAEKINATIKSKEGAATVDLIRGWLLFAQNKIKPFEAEVKVQTAIVNYRDIDDELGVAEGYELLAAIYTHRGEYEEATRLCEKGLDICSRIGAPMIEASIRETLSSAIQNGSACENDSIRARRELENAAKIFAACGALARAEKLQKHLDS